MSGNRHALLDHRKPKGSFMGDQLGQLVEDVDWMWDYRVCAFFHMQGGREGSQEKEPVWSWLGLRKRNWSRRESVGSSMQDAGRQERAEVLATKCRSELLRPWTLEMPERMEGREEKRLRKHLGGGKRRFIYIYLPPTPVWELGRVGTTGNGRGNWITIWMTGGEEEGNGVV